MTYFGFLARYVVAPTLLLRIVEQLDKRRGKSLPEALQSWPAWNIIAAMAGVAVFWTTLWDNYLVATKVWWYDPKRVTGLILGYVPIEEYSFFVLQTLLTGSWLLLLARNLKMDSATTPVTEEKPENDEYAASLRASRSQRIRVITTAGVSVGWIASLLLLASRWKPGSYLGLLMAWALPPLMVQSAFGGDILWRWRRLVLATLVPTTLYLGAADRFAITSGNWTINPEKTLGIHLFRTLPLEEFLFFLMTNTLIASGVTLSMTQESKARMTRYLSATSTFLRGIRRLFAR